MYQYSKAAAIERSNGAQWLPVDIENLLVYDIFTNYSKVVVELTTIYLTAPIFVDLDTLKVDYASYPGTFAALLVSLGNRTLEQTDHLPNSVIKYWKYSDAFRAGYKVKLCMAGVNVPANYPESEFHDVALSRPNFDTDLQMLHDYCLVTVNGMLHMTDSDGTSCFVYGAGKTLRKSRLNQLGLISFMDIGKIKKIPITDDMIFGQSDTEALSHRTYLQLNENLTNKSVLLSIGGYLLLPGEAGFTQTSDQIFSINPSALNLLERFFESSNYLDLSSLGLSTDEDFKDAINVPEFLSDAVFKECLKLSQSFFIVVDAPNLFVNRINIRHSGMPGMFTTYQDPVYPLAVGYGKLAEYWKTHEDGHWAVSVQDSYYRNFAFDGVQTSSMKNTTPSLLPFKPTYNSRGHLLELGSYKS